MDQTENTISNNKSIIVETCLWRRCIETAVLLLLHACSYLRGCVYEPLFGNGHCIFAYLAAMVVHAAASTFGLEP
jgi:hypothetical protein